MTRDKKLLYAGIAIVLGLMLMRIAWLIVSAIVGTIIVTLGSVLFLGGVIVFSLTFFKNNRRF